MHEELIQIADEGAQYFKGSPYADVIVSRLRALAVPQPNGGEALRRIHGLANEAVKVMDEGEYPERSAIAEIRAIAGSEYPKLEAKPDASAPPRESAAQTAGAISLVGSNLRNEKAIEPAGESAATEHPDKEDK